jgi:putative endonuclease
MSRAPLPTWVPRSARQLRGAAAEDAACILLEQSGLVVVERNVRFRAGEIDIVARDGATLVFVEVRSRTRMDDSAWSLAGAKQGKMRRAAQLYLLRRHGARWPPCRFDAVLLGDGRIRWVRDAFIFEEGC